jgi:hypothetical protein
MFFTLPMMYKNECLGMEDGGSVQYENQHKKYHMFLFFQGGQYGADRGWCRMQGHYWSIMKDWTNKVEQVRLTYNIPLNLEVVSQCLGSRKCQNLI